MMPKSKCLALGVGFILLSMVFFISAQPVIDGDVLNKFNNNSWVTITVTLSDVGEKNMNIVLQSEIISNFTEDEFKLNWKSSNGRGFAGNITKEGLEKLENNTNVLRVYLPITGSTTEGICGDEICNGKENCETCVIDCGCSNKNREECVEGICIIKEVNDSGNFNRLWVIIISVILFVIIVYFVRKKRE